jgi:hypothetical protein
MAEGFENLMTSKKTDSLVIQAINETTQIVKPEKKQNNKKGVFTLPWAFKLLDARVRYKEKYQTASVLTSQSKSLAAADVLQSLNKRQRKQMEKALQAREILSKL